MVPGSGSDRGCAHAQLTVLTCMDSRLIPERFLGLDIGDAEIIRNGGGRVTLDVLRCGLLTHT
jgi:carbonic anhydrase